MELKSSKWPIYLSIIWLATVTALGAWWLVIIVRITGEFQKKFQFNPFGTTNWGQMIKWEGITFLVALLLLSATLFFLYYRDFKKNRSMQAFFAGLTHELKTPLASMRLQAEVLSEFAKNDGNEKYQALTNRLVEDAGRLETELDKILQLSRIERGGVLNPTTINLQLFTKNIAKKFSDRLEINFHGENEINVSADEFALALILRNLFDNTLIHSGSTKVDIEIKKNKSMIEFHYNDHGKAFEGDSKQLGKLFYKHNSAKGSGIGLYLVGQMMKLMDGELAMTMEPNLAFQLSFKEEA